MEISARDICEGDTLAVYGTAGEVILLCDVSTQEEMVLVGLGPEVLILFAHERVQVQQ